MWQICDAITASFFLFIEVWVYPSVTLEVVCLNNSWTVKKSASLSFLFEVLNDSLNLFPLIWISSQNIFPRFTKNIFQFFIDQTSCAGTVRAFMNWSNSSMSKRIIFPCLKWGILRWEVHWYKVLEEYIKIVNEEKLKKDREMAKKRELIYHSPLSADEIEKILKREIKKRQKKKIKKKSNN